MRRVLLSELLLDKPLPWSLYDEHGNLLLREGYVISIPRHLDSLLKRGAYIQATPIASAFIETQSNTSTQAQFAFRASSLPSVQPVFGRAEALAQTLKRLHQHLQTQTLQAALRDIVRSLAHSVMQACADDADALLAAFHLDRQSPYIVIQQLLGCALTEIAARDMGMDAPTRLSLACASLTRDIALLPWQAQLDMQTHRLDANQNALIRVHPIRSAEILQENGVDDPLWLELVRQHHERLDGTGYPHGISGDAMLPGARLLAIADSYAAMVTPRPNREGRLPKDALKALYLQRASLYDEALLRLSVGALTTLPPGTMVRLANDELAVVRSRPKKGEPVELWALYSQNGMPIMTPQRRDASTPAHAITDVLRIEDCRSAALVMKRFWTHS